MAASSVSAPTHEVLFSDNSPAMPLPLSVSEIEQVIFAVLEHEELRRSCCVSLSVVSTEHMRALNTQWRGCDAPTDVLSFECDSPLDDALPEGEAVQLGDIVLAPSVIAEQAMRFHTTYADECRLMLVHGMLHLLGYDHMDETSALAMEKRELDILRKLAQERGEDPSKLALGPITRHADE